MIKYKLKWVYVEYSEKFERDVLIVPLVWRWIDWKYDKFISADEALSIVDNAVINLEEKNSILSQKDKANFGKQPLF